VRYAQTSRAICERHCASLYLIIAKPVQISKSRVARRRGFTGNRDCDWQQKVEKRVTLPGQATISLILVVSASASIRQAGDQGHATATMTLLSANLEVTAAPPPRTVRKALHTTACIVAVLLRTVS
jgi:hypothetical protein